MPCCGNPTVADVYESASCVYASLDQLAKSHGTASIAGVVPVVGAIYERLEELLCHGNRISWNIKAEIDHIEKQKESIKQKRRLLVEHFNEEYNSVLDLWRKDTTFMQIILSDMQVEAERLKTLIKNREFDVDALKFQKVVDYTEEDRQYFGTARNFIKELTLCVVQKEEQIVEAHKELNHNLMDMESLCELFGPLQSSEALVQKIY